MTHDHDANDNRRFKLKANWVLIGFLAVAGFFLFTEHRAHVLGILPYLLLLACPLMHLFMHGGHGGHGGHGDHDATRNDRAQDRKPSEGERK